MKHISPHVILTGLCCSLLLFVNTSCRKAQTDALGSKPGRSSFSGLKPASIPAFSIDVPKPPKSGGQLFTAKAWLDGKKLDGGPGTIATGLTEKGIKFSNLVDQSKAIYQKFFEATEFTVDVPNSNVVYPGSIIQGGSVDNFLLRPILGYGRPITVSVSIPTSPNKVSKTVALASGAEMRRIVREALTNEFAGSGGVAKMNYEMKAFSYYQEMKELYRYNTKSNLLFINSATASDRNVDMIKRNTGVMVRFWQENFTIDMDIPEDGQLIDRNADPAIFEGHKPLYVSTVKYGRMGIMSIESDEEESKVIATFQKAFSILGIVNGGSTLTDEEQRIINAADVKVSMVGVAGEDAVQTIAGVSGLATLLAKGQTYTPQLPGVPIAFSMRDVDTDSTIVAPFQVNFGPFDKIYARIETLFQQTSNNVGGNATGYQTTRNIFLRFYQDPACTVEDKAYNFIKFDYRFKSQYDYQYTNPPSRSSGTSYLSTESVYNTEKGHTKLLYANYRTESYIRLPDGYTSNEIKTPELLEGVGYIPVASLIK
ncbi:thiol-activated cytolysin family protein [Chitinophaga vietnamensis]|uniref:thiol-activated cytolysin family protein n=1 Tax=Chitinophaga vietnamensis TaxID=2593957 RepID=UPI00117759F9|nr:thiol-activated cytolysin family protein [Chitinophaga vietnamensis]